jgi:outer membrane lipopolysaccharide assembly protein LptE/RlpB
VYKTEERNQIVLNMMRSKIALEVFVRLTGLTAKQVQKTQKSLHEKIPEAKKVIAIAQRGFCFFGL